MGSIGTNKSSIGPLGEEIAENFLENHDFVIIQRNYRKTFGEIDIIAKKQEILHFIEVKSVSRITNCKNFEDYHRPEDNVDYSKMRKIRRTIEVYLNDINDESEWQFGVITVKVDKESGNHEVNFLNNLVV